MGVHSLPTAKVAPRLALDAGWLISGRLPFHAAAPRRFRLPAQVRQATAPTYSGAASWAARYRAPPGRRARQLSRRSL